MDVIGPAVDAPSPRVVRIPHDAELGGKHDLVALGPDGAADELLVRVRAVDVGGIEEVDAQLEGPVDGGHGLVAVAGAVELAHAHAAEALGRHCEALAAEGTVGNSHAP